MRIRTLADGSTAHGESDATVPEDATTIERLAHHRRQAILALNVRGVRLLHMADVGVVYQVDAALAWHHSGAESRHADHLRAPVAKPPIDRTLALLARLAAAPDARTLATLPSQPSPDRP